MSNPEIYAAGCAALDLASTQYGLQSGFVESNPIYPEGYEVLTGVVFSAAFHYGLRRVLAIQYHGERGKAPAWFGYGSVRCAAGLYNLNFIRENK